ncbi:MAG TPA: ABC transporter permease [Opitutaceae bacterium]|nr:ABC transporter permease [Opitutaceae bacterium]
MNALLAHLGISLRLHFRNRMALLYGYLFPLIFLVAFWVLYRHEKIPLLRHMGELLTVSVLGGACFGLPTTLVSERERGVWRRYRLTPVPTWLVVTSTAIARYFIIMSAGLLQLTVALAMGMTLPAHPFDLWVAFTFVAFAFIGLGLVIATLADTVPAVQALGQCIFLPMLIIGGVAVPLASLPEWTQHVSAFFPGRYAVDALQGCVNGAGLPGIRLSLLALTLIGFAGCVAGARLFRWDAQQRFAARAGKAWLLPVLAAWLAVGWLAESRGRVLIKTEPPVVGSTKSIPSTPSIPSTSTAPAPAPVPPPPVPPKPAAPWTRITEKDIASLDYAVPPDQGIVAPIAAEDEEPYDFLVEQVKGVRDKLPTWEPAADPDEIQAVRNLLAVAGVPDAIQLPVERFLPRVVFERLQEAYPTEKLVKILTWIAMHPEEGTVVDSLADLGIDGQAGDLMQVRERIYLYAIKFVARLTGRKTG